MFKINDEVWRVLLVSPNHPQLQRSDGSYSIGACNNDTGCIYVNERLEGSMLKKVICHEVAHAAMFSYDIYLEPAQEEILADLIASYGHEIIFMTNKIFNRIKNRGTM